MFWSEPLSQWPVWDRCQLRLPVSWPFRRSFGYVKSYHENVSFREIGGFQKYLKKIIIWKNIWAILTSHAVEPQKSWFKNISHLLQLSVLISSKVFVLPSISLGSLLKTRPQIYGQSKINRNVTVVLYGYLDLGHLTALSFLLFSEKNLQKHLYSL